MEINLELLATIRNYQLHLQLGRSIEIILGKSRYLIKSFVWIVSIIKGVSIVPFWTLINCKFLTILCFTATITPCSENSPTQIVETDNPGLLAMRMFGPDGVQGSFLVLLHPFLRMPTSNLVGVQCIAPGPDGLTVIFTECTGDIAEMWVYGTTIGSWLQIAFP